VLKNETEKNIFHYTNLQKNFKKYKLKERWSKLKYNIFFIFNWKVKLKKINIVKGHFKTRMSIKIDMKNKHNTMIKGWNWKEYYFLQQNKKKNQNNKDQIEKHNTINMNWRMKLITTATFTKESRKKIKNSKNKDHIREYDIWQIEIE